MMKIDEVDRLFYVFWGEEHGKPSTILGASAQQDQERFAFQII